MATGRTHPRFCRAYLDGYDMSGYSRSYGPLSQTFDEGPDDTFGTDVIGFWPGNSEISIGVLNAVLDNTATSGLHVIANGAGVTRDVMLPIGIQAAPADNDPVFSAQLKQLGYHGQPDANPVGVSIPFGNTSYLADNLIYSRPWGVLLWSNQEITAVNTAIGLDQAAQTTKGGWMMYQIFAGDGTATIKTQDADTNLDGSFGDLLSSGVIDCSAATSGVVALAKSATVERYVRPQITLGTATTVTLALSWHRGL